MTEEIVGVDVQAQVPVYGEDEVVISFSELAENSASTPADVSDAELISLVVNWFDLEDADALKQKIMGEHYRPERELLVSRPATGNILVSTKPELGQP